MHCLQNYASMPTHAYHAIVFYNSHTFFQSLSHLCYQYIVNNTHLNIDLVVSVNKVETKNIICTSLVFFSMQM